MQSLTGINRLAGVVSLFLLLSVFISQMPAQIVVEEIEGHEDTASWALHESGRIFAAVKSTDSVIEYDLNGDEVRKHAVEPEPTEMIVKGDFLVVGCQKSSSFSVINLKTNKVVGKIDLAGKGPYALFCSKVDNGFVYGISNTGSAWWDGEVFQADLKTMKVRKRVKVQQWGQSHAVHVAMSADGNWIIPDARGQSSPSGADLMRVDETECTFTQVRDHHSSFGQIQAGPANRYWTLGNKLYPLDMKASVRNFTGTPVAIHPSYDLVASFTPSSLNFEKFSDAKSLKKQAMSFTSEPPKKTSGRRSRSSNSPFAKSQVLVGFNSKGSHAVAAAGKFCRIVDLKELDIPLKPLLMLDVPTVVEAKIDEAIRIPLRLTNSKLARKVKLELVRGPEGAKITGNQLVWTPTSRHIGRHSAKVTAKLDDTLDEVTFDLNVKAAKMELNFNVTGIHLDQKGEYAIAWGKKIVKPKNGRGSSSHSSNSGSDEVAILDLKSQTVVVQKPLAAGVQSAIIQQPYAFLVPKSGNVLFRFSSKTLGDSKRMFLKDKCVGVSTFTKNQVCTITGDHNYVMTLVDPETMKSTGTKAMGYSHNYRNGITGIRQASPGLIEFQSKLLDKETGYVAVMESNPGLKSLVKVQASNAMHSHQMRDYPRKMFGRYLTRNSIMSASGSAISQAQNKAVYSNPYHPVAFAIRSESKSSGRTYELKNYLETLSLVDGEVLDSRVFDVSNNRNSHSSYNNSRKFFPFKDKVVYIKQNELFSIPLDPASMKSAPLPLHFPITKTPTLGVDKPQTISLKAIGGKGKLDHQLVTEYEGLSVDSDSGMVTIDTPLIWKNYLKKHNSPVSARERMMARADRSNNNQTLSDKDFEELFGKPVPKDKLAFVLPIQLAATDDEAQEDRISVYALVLGEKADIEKLEKKKRAQQEIARKANEAQRVASAAMSKLANAARAAKAAEAKTKNEGAASRMDDLEKRMRRMEATLDAILQKLEKIESGR